MLDFATTILLGVSSQGYIELFAESWVYKLIRVINKVPGVRKKE